MTIVYLLIPLGAVLMAAAAVAFFWAINSGQYDDLDGADTLPLDLAQERSFADAPATADAPKTADVPAMANVRATADAPAMADAPARPDSLLSVPKSTAASNVPDAPSTMPAR